MSKKISLLIVVVILASLISMACVPPPPPPPPPEPATCSPGFWKNHTDDWVGYSPTEKYILDDDNGNHIDTLLDALQGGKYTRESRFIVAGWLNTTNPDAPCD
jgi:hypothetical protein